MTWTEPGEQLAGELAAADPARVIAALDALRDGGADMYVLEMDGGVAMSDEEIEAARLARLATAACLPAMTELAEPTSEPAVRGAALAALVEVVYTHPNKCAFPDVPEDLARRAVDWLDAGDPLVVVRALQILFKMVQPGSLQEIRDGALHIRSALWCGGVVRERIARVIDLLGDRDEHVVGMAALLLRRIRCRAAAGALRDALPRAPESIAHTLVRLAPDEVELGRLVDAVVEGAGRPRRRYRDVFGADYTVDRSSGWQGVYSFHASLESPEWEAELFFTAALDELGDACLPAIADRLDAAIERCEPLLRALRRRRCPELRGLLNRAFEIPGLRMHAIEPLTAVADQTSTEPLRRGLADEDQPYTRLCIARALARAGDDAPLLAMLDSGAGDEFVRREIAAAADDADRLEARLELEESPEVRCALLRSLGRSRPAAALVRIDRAFRAEPDLEHRRDLIDAACELDGDAVYPVVAAWYRDLDDLDDDDGSLLRRIAYEMGHRGDPAAVPYLVEMFELDRRGPSRFDLVIAMGRAGGPGAAAFFERLIDEGAAASIFDHALVKGLANCRAPGVARLFGRALPAIKDQGLRRDVARALVAIGTEEALEILEPIIAARATPLYGLAALGTDRAVDLAVLILGRLRKQKRRDHAVEAKLMRELARTGHPTAIAWLQRRRRGSHVPAALALLAIDPSFLDAELAGAIVDHLSHFEWHQGFYGDHRDFFTARDEVVAALAAHEPRANPRVAGLLRELDSLAVVEPDPFADWRDPVIELALASQARLLECLERYRGGQ